MEDPEAQRIDALLGRLNQGDAAALEELLPLVYDRLRALASGRFGSNRPYSTLQPTELVHEVFLRLGRREGVEYTDRVHFFAVAATAMRQILIDRARRRDSSKRGGDRRRVTLTGLGSGPNAEHVVDVIAVHDALERLARYSERQARIVELRLFGGLNHAEVGEVLGVSPSTAEKEWRRARAFLLSDLAPSEG